MARTLPIIPDPVRRVTRYSVACWLLAFLPLFFGAWSLAFGSAAYAEQGNMAATWVAFTLAGVMTVASAVLPVSWWSYRTARRGSWAFLHVSLVVYVLLGVANVGTWASSPSAERSAGGFLLPLVWGLCATFALKALRELEARTWVADCAEWNKP